MSGAIIVVQRHTAGDRSDRGVQAPLLFARILQFDMLPARAPTREIAFAIEYLFISIARNRDPCRRATDVTCSPSRAASASISRLNEERLAASPSSSTR